MKCFHFNVSLFVFQVNSCKCISFLFIRNVSQQFSILEFAKLYIEKFEKRFMKYRGDFVIRPA